MTFQSLDNLKRKCGEVEREKDLQIAQRTTLEELHKTAMDELGQTHVAECSAQRENHEMQVAALEGEIETGKRVRCAS